VQFGSENHFFTTKDTLRLRSGQAPGTK
jgi:hypothetical protein